MLQRAFPVFILLLWGTAQAQSPEALEWLRKIHAAAQKLSYSGTFVYQQGSRSETSRITHYVDASGDVEKLEVLDGAPREIIRTRNIVRCYLPASRVVKVERREAERGFPALLPSGSRRSRRTTTSRWATATASRASIAARCCSSPRTTCATATACTPTRRAACCSRR